jgi:hypothetical protein
LRPFFVAKFLREIDMLYTNTKLISAKDLDGAIENLRKWRANDRVIRTYSSEEKCQSCIKDAQAADRHEQEVHEKFIRLKERFIQNPKKLADSILNYKIYLEIKLKRHHQIETIVQVVTRGGMTVEESMPIAQKTKIALEEAERRIDVLLSN